MATNKLRLKLKANPVLLRAYGAGVPIRLSDEGAVETASDGPVWIQVAKEGKWKGHVSGRVVEFTAKTFEQLVTNFRSHPAFEAGEDGVGKAKVVPFDYEHASEMNPATGSLPVTGAPAPAWCLDLQVRDGDEGLELWAWTQLGTKAREQIRAEEYQWTSVAVWANAKDHVSGKDVGPVLTSIAFTNHPFIQGMAPMQASVSIYGKAESAEEVIVGVRDLLGLPPDSARDAVVLELEALRSAMSDGRSGPGYPDGYGWLVDSVRRLLGLRVLASTDEIINSAGQVIGAVTDPTSPAPLPTPKEPNMTQAATSNLASQLADLLNCRDTEPVLLAAVAKEKAKGDSLDQLLALFDSDDMGALLGDAAKTIEKAKKADEYLAGLNAAREKLGAGEKKEAEAEVEQIAASMGLTGKTLEGFKPLLLNARLACNDADPAKAAQLLSEFRQRYPLPEPGKQLLTQQVVAGPGSTQLGGPHTALPGNGGSQEQKPAHVQLFSAYPGNNDIEKAIAYHREKTPGFDKHPYQTQVRAASGFVRTGQLAL